VTTPGSVLVKYAIGEQVDLPLPPGSFVFGCASVLMVSAVLVQRRVAEPKSAAPAIEPFPAEPTGWVRGTVAVAALGLLLAAGPLGGQEMMGNTLPPTFWFLVGAAVPLLVGLVGDFTRPVNPFAAIARAADRPVLRQLVVRRWAAVAWPRLLGYWVSVVLFVLVVVSELVVIGEWVDREPSALPRVTAAGLFGYAVICAGGGLVFGAQAWNARAELFSVLFATWGRLGWFRFGTPGRRGFAGGLHLPFEASPSRVTGVLLLLVWVSSDGLLSIPRRARFTDHPPSGPQLGTTGGLPVCLLALVGLTSVMLAVLGILALITARTGRHGGGGLTALTGLLPSLLPIAYGYLLAHYLEHLLVSWPRLLLLLDDLLDDVLDDLLRHGWRLLPPSFSGAAAPDAVPEPLTPDSLSAPVLSDALMMAPGGTPTAMIWYMQVGVILLAHAVSVLLAHRYLHLRSAGPALARRSEWPWLVALASYTMVNLWLLARPLIPSALV
jgi:hypothetical protein